MQSLGIEIRKTLLYSNVWSFRGELLDDSMYKV